MAEEQNVNGNAGNIRLNNFLHEVLKWNQMGDSNTDIECLAGTEKGIDSVFSYKWNSKSNQQIVIVESKAYANMRDINKSLIQDWVYTLFEKIDCVSHSNDFRTKFHPETNAQFNMGLIGLWIRNSDTYDDDKLRNILAQLKVPNLKIPVNIGFISNPIISRFCAIHEKVERLKQHSDYSEINYYIPDQGTRPLSDGRAIPMESLLSKFVFYKTRKRQPLRGQSGINEYDSFLVFYLGKIEAYEDLHFVLV